MQHYHADFAREKEGLFDISADMTRQYKGMQEELLARLNKLEETIQQQKDDLEKSQLQLEEVRREKAQELAQKDAEIQEQKAKMDEQKRARTEFCATLKEKYTLEEEVKGKKQAWGDKKIVKELLAQAEAAVSSMIDKASTIAAAEAPPAPAAEETASLVKEVASGAITEALRRASAREKATAAKASLQAKSPGWAARHAQDVQPPCEPEQGPGAQDLQRARWG